MTKMFRTPTPHPMIDRILSGEDICIAEIMLDNARKMIDHIAMHERGECTKTGSKGHFHPMSDPVDDGAHARRLMIEAPDHCTCGRH